MVRDRPGRVHARERSQALHGESLDPTSGAFDGVVDFDAAVRDPANPTRLRPAYDFDGVHLTDAGYEAMATSINLSTLF